LGREKQERREREGREKGERREREGREKANILAALEVEISTTEKCSFWWTTPMEEVVLPINLVWL
jgi:hypothetical protein